MGQPPSMKVGETCQVQLSTKRILNSMQYGFFFALPHGENTNSGLESTVTILMVSEKQFRVPHSTIQ